MQATKTVPAASTSKEPLYLQIARTLKDQILEGSYPVGSHLPTEEQLGERFGVSRHTVRAALRSLREDGLITSRRRTGSIVATPQDIHAVHTTSIDDLVKYAAGGRFILEAIEMIVLDERQAARLGVAPHTEWLSLRGFGQLTGHGLPTSWVEYYIHRDYASVGRLIPRQTGAVFRLIEDLFGKPIVEVEQDITGGPMSRPVARRLQLEAGSPAIEVRRTYRMAEGKIAQVTVDTHAASLFRHRMTMHRLKG